MLERFGITVTGIKIVRDLISAIGSRQFCLIIGNPDNSAWGFGCSTGIIKTFWYIQVKDGKLVRGRNVPEDHIREFGRIA